MDKSDILKIIMPQRTKQIALAWSILREAHLAEDAYQDMLAKVFENEAIFEGPRHLRDWSWKVLRNRCYRMIRDQKYQEVLLDESVLELVDAELESREAEPLDKMADALRHCLAGLTANAQRIVRMRYFQGMRGNQVAAVLGRKPDAVYKALQRIYDTLGQCIRERLDAEESWEGAK